MINPLRMVVYGTYIVAEILKGGTKIAVDAFTPGMGISPTIVELPLRCDTDIEVSLMASSITITPGTVTLGIAPASEQAPATLFVHALYGQSRDEVVDGLRDMEDRLLRMTRGPGWEQREEPHRTPRTVEP